jgi:hypothetical protein
MKVGGGNMHDKMEVDYRSKTAVRKYLF